VVARARRRSVRKRIGVRLGQHTSADVPNKEAAVLTPPAHEQHGDDAQRDEQADGGPVVEQLGRPRKARRGSNG